jgi:SAM-dependent methyltransferase
MPEVSAPRTKSQAPRTEGMRPAASREELPQVHSKAETLPQRNTGKTPPFQPASGPAKAAAACGSASPLLPVPATTDTAGLVAMKGALEATRHQSPLDVLGDPASAERFSGFYGSVLNVFDPKARDRVVADLLKQHPDDVDAFREAMFERRQDLLPGALTKSKRLVQSARKQHKDLAAQMKVLLKDIRKVDGWLDIGEPGGLMSGPDLEITGRSITLYDNKGAIMDRLAAGTAHLPAKEKLPFSYDLPSKEVIPNETLDLITCGIGLHHHPVEEINDIAQRLFDMLRPGGSFVLREHDVRTVEEQQFADMAHVMFDVGTGIPFDTDTVERRFFLSLETWTRIMESHGFVRTNDPPQTVVGDSSRNTFIRFVKPETASSLSPLESMQRLAAKDPAYRRDEAKTWATTVEWADVDLATSFAEFLKEHPSQDFPYFEAAQLYWSLLSASKEAAGGVDAYKSMNMFVAGMGSLKNVFAGFTALPSKADEPRPLPDPLSPVKQQTIDDAGRYAEFIHVTPWYEYPWTEQTKDLWSTYAESRNAGTKQSGDLSTVLKKTAGNAGKAAVASPMAAFFSQPDNHQAETLGVIVRANSQQLGTAMKDFEGKTGQTIDVAGSNSDYHLLQIPRYVPFTEALVDLARSGAQIQEISGNSRIQLHVRVPADRANLIETDIPGATAKFTYQMPGSESTEVGYEVQVGELARTLAAIDAQNFEVVRFHDF